MSKSSSAAAVSSDAGVQLMAAGEFGGAAGRESGGGARPDPLSCAGQSSSAAVVCGGEACPWHTETEQNPCSVPCCLQVGGRERCGFRGTSLAFKTECTLPAVPDPTCDEVVQFEGCCDERLHRCGIIGGFAPGCQTTSAFVTLPKVPKTCGLDSDAGEADAG
jgi:hypothetical protein